MRIACILAFVLLASNASAQVSIERAAEILRTVHDAERANLGTTSTRDQRNAFFARVVGIIHYGHQVYNQTPDTSWCIKDGGGGRPQSDDVIVQCRSRQAFDMMGGVGADGYTFGWHAIGVLPSDQNVYIPPRPADASSGGGGGGGGGTTPPAVNLQPVLDAIAALTAQVAALTAKVDAVAGVAVETRDAAKSAEHDSREVNAWRMVPFPPAVIPCLRGRIAKAFGGSSETTFCPVP